MPMRPPAPSPAMRPQPLYRAVQQHLRQYVRENGLAAGDRLAPEADLAAAFGVSRNSLREAVKALESVGMLEVRRGIGVFVRDLSLEPLLAHLGSGLGPRDLADILEIRRTLEVGLAARALAALTAADRAELTEVAAAMGRRARRGETFAALDRAFHQVLFRSLGNRVLLRLIDVFWLAFHQASGFFDLANHDPVATWRDHAAILAAVERGDASLVRERLAQHYGAIAAVLSRHAPAGAGTFNHEGNPP